MPHEERQALEKFLLSRELILKPYSVLLLYPDTGNDPGNLLCPYGGGKTPTLPLPTHGQKPRLPIWEFRERISYP